MKGLYKISTGELDGLFAEIAREMRLYAPLRQGNELNFGLWGASVTVDLHGLKTDNTPKDLFLPQSEDLYSASLKGGDIKINPAEAEFAPFVVFGVKACDIKATAVLDNIFLKGDFVDHNYKLRRENALIVSLACNKPGMSCFCAAFNLDAAAPGGDIATWLCNEYLYLQAQNEKGEGFIKQFAHLLQEAEEGEIAPIQAEIREKIAALPYSELPLENFTPENMLKLFNHENWNILYKACLGCGICTYICPTCGCYDIRDFEAKCGEIQRFRCWDSCMYPDFTLMAHGNPRISQKERFRQRFMHKLAYHPEKFAEYGCVGCGRCVNKCPVSLNIVKIIKSLGGE
ncbi:MAG: 4Fe-4S dicluster domain-containing protein [Clostridiales bacterium]|nr:4Fe-4S dicluster domain-containing protein [Clostridiales bacterium]